MFDTLTQNLVTQLAPMFGSMLVIVLVFSLALAQVRSGFIRQLGAYAAVLTWVGWMAHYYKVV